MTKSERERVHQLTAALPLRYRLSEKIYLVVHNLTARPTCTICNAAEITSYKPKTGYGRYCSSRCFGLDKELRRVIIGKTDMAARTQRYKKTCTKIYGVDHPLKVKTIADQALATKRARYNGKTRTPEGTAIVSVTFKKTRKELPAIMLKKYGVTHPMHLESVKRQVRATNLARYGYEFVTQSPVVKEKTQATNLARYGVKHFFQSSGFKRWYREHMTATYGGFVGQAGTVMHDKALVTLQASYGVDNPTKNPIVAGRVATALKLNGLPRTLEQLNRLHEMGYKFDGDVIALHLANQPITVTHRCGKSYQGGLGSAFQHCSCLEVMSMLQWSVFDFITSAVPSTEVIPNDRQAISPLEIDIFIPSMSLGIEVNGLYWHRDAVGRYRCQEKLMQCKAAGIKLIQLFEHELSSGDERWKNLLRVKLGLATSTYHGRKLKVSKQVSWFEETEFLNANHMQGYVRSKLCLGLRDLKTNELLVIASFGPPRFTKKASWELLRLATKGACVVRGGASRLLTAFFKEVGPTSLVSYADNRWSSGDVYRTLGFAEVSVNQPNYWYIKGNDLLSRYECQKHKLKALLPFFDEDLTELENMVSNGYYRVSDAGSRTFMLTR